MFQNSPVVKNLLLINIITFIVASLIELSGLSIIRTFALFPFNSGYFYLHQLITHQFLHAGIFHLVFNMLALATIAPNVESSLGSRKFLHYYLISGVGAALLHLMMINSNNPMVGASGALFGTLILFTFLNPNEKLFIFFIPIGIKAKFLVPTIVILEIYLGFNSTTDGIGHWAHIGGALTGSVLYLTNKIRFDKNEN